MVRVSQIAGVFQKMIFESCTLLHIIPFAKIIGPVEIKNAKSEFSRFFLDLNFGVFPPWIHEKYRFFYLRLSPYIEVIEVQTKKTMTKYYKEKKLQ